MNPELLTATEMISAFRSRKLSPVEVTKAALARIDRLNPQINAFYLVDHEGALEAARSSEQRWCEKKPLGSFDGVPTSIKDSLQTIGHARHFGSVAFEKALRPSNNDAPAVARLKEAGAVILGRTTMCDFGLLPSGYSTAFGHARNPWDLSRTPGGSSSGAAASVAAGINPVALGSDIVGSIRLPASFCGLVGHKPSYGRVPFFFQNSPAVVTGPIGRTVEDVAALLTLVARPDDRDFTALPYDAVDYAASLDVRPTTKSIGLLREMGFGPSPDSETLAVVEAKARELASTLGAKLVELKPPFKTSDLDVAEDFYRIRCLSQLEHLEPEQQARAELIAAWVAPARKMTAAEGHARFDALQMIRYRAMRLMSECDYLVLPTVAVPAFHAELPAIGREQIFSGWSNTFVFNLTEQPAISVPAGLTQQGLPIGLQVVGRRFDDLGVLRMGRTAELTWGPFPSAPMANPS